MRALRFVNMHPSGGASQNRMGRRRNPLWVHFCKVEKLEGAAAASNFKTPRAKCIHCQGTVSGTPVNMKTHISNCKSVPKSTEIAELLMATPSKKTPPPPKLMVGPPSFKSLQSTSFHALKQLIEDKKATIGVVGLGYVGLPLAHTLHSAGFPVVGFDTDTRKVEALARGESYIRHIPANHVEALSTSTRFTPTTTFPALCACHVVLICLPTPVGSHDEPDMSYVFSTVRALAPILRSGSLVILESTTYPGATDTELAQILSRGGEAVLGRDFFLAYSPEREDPGNAQFSTRDIPKLVGGADPDSGTLAAALYTAGGFATPIVVSCARVAECAKLLENTFRAVNIALVNELKHVFRGMGINVHEVLDAAATKPFGFSRFDPGPGIGGHCIPIDPFYLAWKARECGHQSAFIELAAKVNASMPGRIVQSVQNALNAEGKAVNGSRILILGVAYKAEVDDIREAPALVIWERLMELGGHVRYHDPFVTTIAMSRKHKQLAGEKSIELPPSGQDLKKFYDVIVVVTNHAAFDGYTFLDGFNKPVVDTRNCVPNDIRAKVVNA